MPDPTVRLSVKGRIAATTVALLAVTLGGVSAFVVAQQHDRGAGESAEALTRRQPSARPATCRASSTAPSAPRATCRARCRACRRTGGTRAQADGVERGAARAPRRTTSASGRAGSRTPSTAATPRHVRTAGSDATGRCVSYWYRDGGAIARAPLTGYTKPGAATTTCCR